MNNSFLSANYKTRPSSSRTYPRLPDCLVSPLEAATGKGGNHSWQLTRQSSQPRTTVYKLFRALYLPTVPNNPRCPIATYTCTLTNLSVLGLFLPINNSNLLFLDQSDRLISNSFYCSTHAYTICSDICLIFK